jgi:hypothetical protein
MKLIRSLATWLALFFVALPISAGVINAPNDHASHHAAMPGAPEIDSSRLMVPAAGQAVPRIKTTTVPFNVNAFPAAFRTTCEPSHMAWEDPLVWPGQPGKSHLHTFFGNTSTDANSTQASLSAAPSTCRGGSLNRSSYWVPSMIDTRTGAPIKPNALMVYYKEGYSLDRATYSGRFANVPVGLRIIAGTASNSVDVTAPPGFPWTWSPYYHECLRTGGMRGQQIPNCPMGDEIWTTLHFPQCWDGVNLDSPDHKSHMRYPVAGKCPVTHPVAIPEITYLVKYPVSEAGAPAFWRLSSDGYDPALPPGRSMHGDYWMVWDQSVMHRIVSQCVNGHLDCHADLLGDGSILY